MGSMWRAGQAAQYLANDMVYYDVAVGTPVEGKARAEKEAIGAFIKAVRTCTGR